MEVLLTQIIFGIKFELFILPMMRIILFTATSTGISLLKIYEDHLYRRRNRIAHNTQSYQQNLPTLKTLVNDDYLYENYFVHFSLLVLIDNIFIELFRKYIIFNEDYTE